MPKPHIPFPINESYLTDLMDDTNNPTSLAQLYFSKAQELDEIENKLADELFHLIPNIAVGIQFSPWSKIVSFKLNQPIDNPIDDSILQKLWEMGFKTCHVHYSDGIFKTYHPPLDVK